MGIQIQNTISKFLKTKNQTQKRPPKVLKITKNVYWGLKSKCLRKHDTPKVDILIQNTISKFSKTKNQTKKRPPKIPKNQKHI